MLKSLPTFTTMTIVMKKRIKHYRAYKCYKIKHTWRVVVYWLQWLIKLSNGTSIQYWRKRIRAIRHFVLFCMPLSTGSICRSIYIVQRMIKSSYRWIYLIFLLYIIGTHIQSSHQIQKSNSGHPPPLKLLSSTLGCPP